MAEPTHTTDMHDASPPCLSGSSAIMSYQTERIANLLLVRANLLREKDYTEKKWRFVEGELGQLLDERFDFQLQFDSYISQIRGLHRQLQEGLEAGLNTPNHLANHAARLKDTTNRWVTEEEKARTTWANIRGLCLETIPETPPTTHMELLATEL